eukprot:2595475-Alexandrium_andersonii.AAC.1
MAAAHRTNRLTVAGDSRVLAYGQGSAPGGPWADVFFGLLHAKASRDIKHVLLSHGLGAKI